MPIFCPSSDTANDSLMVTHFRKESTTPLSGNVTKRRTEGPPGVQPASGGTSHTSSDTANDSLMVTHFRKESATPLSGNVTKRRTEALASNLHRVVLHTHDVLVHIAHLGKLHQRILYPPGNGDRLTQGGGVLLELRLEQQ